MYHILQISGIAATITYIVDGVFKFLELRRKLRAQRIAAGSGDAKVEEPFVDEVQSPTETERDIVIDTEDEPKSPTTTD